MEIMISYFWLIKLAFALFTIYIGYKWMIVKKFESKFYGIIFVVLVLLGFFVPVKLDVDTRTHQVYTNTKIENSKALPEKVVDDSFKSTTNKEIGISKEDLK